MVSSTMTKPTVSVIIPIYNAAKWLAQALFSVAKQKDSCLEIIAIDDGSNDESLEIAQRAGKTFEVFKVLRNDKNLGIVASLNRGLDTAQGRFIARMDADDICHPARFIRQVAFLEQTGIDLCGSWFTEFGQGLSRTVRWPHEEPALRAAMLFQNTICHPTVMARREVFEKFRYREEYRLAEDYDLFARASAEFRIANVPESLLRYRRHAQQATQARRDSMEQVTRRIRLEALYAQQIYPTTEEQRLHNLIRAPSSITNIGDLDGIEAWLLKLFSLQDDPQGKRVVASQWVRACIRAAPLGDRMWNAFRSSPLHDAAAVGNIGNLDLLILSMLKLDYGSKPFDVLRRFGLSA